VSASYFGFLRIQTATGVDVNRKGERIARRLRRGKRANQ
jgi:hypothetical protein